MQTISGPGNWQLRIQRHENSISILSALTCDREARLPEEIDGLPVTELGDSAFRGGRNFKASETEELTVICGIADGEWDNRRIQSLYLPESLRSVDAYALIGCTAMETLYLYDNIEELHSTAFMNCRSFQRVHLTRTGERQGPALSCIVKWLQRELDVSVMQCDGSRLRLIFPEYFENYEENGPTHFFTYTIEGTGYTYHNVFDNRTLHLKDYDNLWENYRVMGHEPETALRLAWYRLRLPEELSETAKEAYSDYLKTHMGAALELALQERDMQGLRMLLEYKTASAEELEQAERMARENRITEATAMFLEYSHRSSGRGRSRSFDL